MTNLVLIASLFLALSVSASAQKTPKAQDNNKATSDPTVCPLPFTDMDQYNPFYVHIRCLYCRSIISGYNDGTFRPFNNITRGQMSKVVSSAAGFSETHTTQQYTDVPPSHPFYIWITRLTVRGIVNGYSQPQQCPTGVPCFRPEQDITRGQAARIVSNAAGFSAIPPAGRQTFADVTPSNPFYIYIERLSRRGIISGYDCGTGQINPCTGLLETCDAQRRPYYRWCAPLTRGQAARIVASTFFPVNCKPVPALKAGASPVQPFSLTGFKVDASLHSLNLSGSDQGSPKM